MKIKFILQEITASFFTALALLFIYFFESNFKTENHAIAAGKPTIAIEVIVKSAEKETIEPFIKLPGRVNAEKISYVYPQIGGIIKKVKFTEGSIVKKGQPLYEIDPEIYKAAVESAKKNLEAVKAKKERYETLIKSDAISRQEFDDIIAQYAQAESELSRAKKDLEYTMVLAPISGYIGKSKYTEGALASVSQTSELTTIVQLDPIYVDFEQQSQDVVTSNYNDETVVTIDENHVGTLKFSEMIVDENTDSVRLRAIFPNEDKKLLPGMFITGTIHLNSFEAVTIPQRITNRLPNGTLSVFVVDDNNIARMRIINATQAYNDSWIVEEGLKEGDIVIHDGFQKIGDGTLVNPTLMSDINRKK